VDCAAWESRFESLSAGDGLEQLFSSSGTNSEHSFLSTTPSSSSTEVMELSLWLGDSTDLTAFFFFFNTETCFVLLPFNIGWRRLLRTPALAESDEVFSSSTATHLSNDNRNLPTSADEY